MKQLPAVTQHAKDRAVERFGKSPQDAARWLQDIARKSRYVGRISEGGAMRHVFAYRRICIIMDADQRKIITAYENHRPAAGLRDKVEAVIDAEIARLERREQSFIRRHKGEIARLELERATWRVELLKTRSPAKRIAYKARIKAIDMRTAEIDGRLREIRGQHKAYVKSKVAYA